MLLVWWCEPFETVMRLAWSREAQEPTLCNTPDAGGRSSYPVGLFWLRSAQSAFLQHTTCCWNTTLQCERLIFPVGSTRHSVMCLWQSVCFSLLHNWISACEIGHVTFLALSLLFSPLVSSNNSSCFLHYYSFFFAMAVVCLARRPDSVAVSSSFTVSFSCISQ